MELKMEHLTAVVKASMTQRSPDPITSHRTDGLCVGVIGTDDSAIRGAIDPRTRTIGPPMTQIPQAPNRWFNRHSVCTNKLDWFHRATVFESYGPKQPPATQRILP